MLLNLANWLIAEKMLFISCFYSSYGRSSAASEAPSLLLSSDSSFWSSCALIEFIISAMLRSFPV
jgi:hypothetical protein